jgi:hypothetical protein
VPREQRRAVAARAALLARAPRGQVLRKSGALRRRRVLPPGGRALCAKIGAGQPKLPRKQASILLWNITTQQLHAS